MLILCKSAGPSCVLPCLILLPHLLCADCLRRGGAKKAVASTFAIEKVRSTSQHAAEEVTNPVGSVCLLSLGGPTVARSVVLSCEG